MSHPAPDSDDEARDAWLREALRHAPDATAAPPPALREAILAEARAATSAGAASRNGAPSARGAAGPGLAAGIAWLWAALARPPVAAGFASVMAATLVGMLWWDRPIDDTLPAAPPLQSIEPARSRTPPPQSNEPALPRADTPTPSPPSAMPAPADERSAPVTAPLPPATLGRSEAEAGRAGPALRRKDAAAAPMGEAPRPFPAPLREAAPPADAAPAPADARSDRRSGEKKEQTETQETPRSVPASRAVERAARDAAQKSTAQETLPARPTAPEARSQGEPAATAQPFPSGSGFAGAVATPLAKPAPPPAVQAPDAADAAKRDQVAGARDRVAANATAEQAEAGRQRSAATPAPASPVEPNRQGLAAATPGAPMAALRTALAADPARWSRQGEGGDGAVEPALQAWLAGFDAAARNTWSRAGGADAPGGAGLAAGGRILRLLRDGQVVATIRLDAQRAGFESRLGGALERWSAPLAPGVVERLLATLPAAPH